jgi:hypothetical protein
MNKQKQSTGIKLRIAFGAMSKPLHEQISEHGIPVTQDEMSHYQKDAEAITRLRIRGMLSDKEVGNTQNRLMKNIVKHLNKKGDEATRTGRTDS